MKITFLLHVELRKRFFSLPKASNQFADVVFSLLPNSLMALSKFVKLALLEMPTLPVK
jgi:hypothetical protein